LGLRLFFGNFLPRSYASLWQFPAMPLVLPPVTPENGGRGPLSGALLALEGTEMISEAKLCFPCPGHGDDLGPFVVGRVSSAVFAENPEAALRVVYRALAGEYWRTSGELLEPVLHVGPAVDLKSRAVVLSGAAILGPEGAGPS